jgi:hypothetical protein
MSTRKIKSTVRKILARRLTMLTKRDFYIFIAEYRNVCDPKQLTVELKDIERRYPKTKYDKANDKLRNQSNGL